MSEKIVIFGGTFDPVHHGHLIVARALAELRGLDRICLVPASQSPHKEGTFASAEHRLAMLKLATAGESLFEVSDIELRRTGRSYTYDTVAALRQQYGPAAELSVVIGADMLKDFPLWHRVQELLKLAKIIVVSRPPWDKQIAAIIDKLSNHFSKDILGQIANSVVQTPLVDISSTEIRQRIRDGRSIRYLVPDSVMTYMTDRKLYQPE